MVGRQKLAKHCAATPVIAATPASMEAWVQSGGARSSIQLPVPSRRWRCRNMTSKRAGSGQSWTLRTATANISPYGSLSQYDHWPRHLEFLGLVGVTFSLPFALPRRTVCPHSQNSRWSTKNRNDLDPPPHGWPLVPSGLSGRDRVMASRSVAARSSRR